MNILNFKRRALEKEGRALQASGANSKTDSGKWAETFWGQKFMKSVSFTIALLCSAAIALADVKITTKSTAGGQSITSTTYIKGARQRTEGMGYTSIYQCDLKRTIQINDKTRTYMITPLQSANAPAGAKPHAPGANHTRRGGIITYTTTVTDTGERREMYGMTARHLKSKTVVEASEGACNPMNMEMETDGWYVDFPGGLDCTTDAAPAFPADAGSDCVDEVRYKTVGTAKLGQPVMVTTTMRFKMEGMPANMPASTSTQEVVDMSTAKLDAALFDIPAGYKEVKTMQELGSPF